MLTPLSDPPPGPAPSAACGGGGAANPHKMAAIFSPPPTLSRRPGLYPASPGLDPQPPRPGGVSTEATRRPRPLVPGSHGVREPKRHKGVT